MVGPEMIMSSQLPFHFTHAFHVMNAPGITFAWVRTHTHSLYVAFSSISHPWKSTHLFGHTRPKSQRQMQQQQKGKANQIARTPLRSAGGWLISVSLHCYPSSWCIHRSVLISFADLMYQVSLLWIYTYMAQVSCKWEHHQPIIEATYKVRSLN
jgi:hypothetical protein